MNEILKQLISDQRAWIEEMNGRALADIEWMKNGSPAESDDQEDSGEEDGDRAGGK